MSSPVLPRYYRQRFLLLCIKYAGGEVSKIDFQKLLFLIHQETYIDYFDFVPYKYGCYSFQAASDLEVLAKARWIRLERNKIIINESVDRYDFVREGERALAINFFHKYKRLRGGELVRYVYTHFPFYALNSKIACKYLDAPPRGDVSGNGKILYTLGYEGLSFEAYINKLIKFNIHVVCDVRKNALSRKFGFSKKVMSELLPNLGITYMHIPELGIDSGRRKNLRTYSDYQRIFNAYVKELDSKKEHIDKIRDIVVSRKNVVLTCYEHDVDSCHRSHLGSYIEKKYRYNIVHL